MPADFRRKGLSPACAVRSDGEGHFLFVPLETEEPPAAATWTHGMGVVRLACCVYRGAVERDKTLELARDCGPAFGPNLMESEQAWTCAVEVAHLAVRLQRIVNGTMQRLMLQGIAGLERRRFVELESGDDEQTIDYLVVAREAPDDYANSLSSLPVVVRRHAGGRYHYAFATKYAEENTSVVEYSTFSLRHEMSLADYLSIQSLIELGEQGEAAVLERLGLSRGDAAPENTSSLVRRRYEARDLPPAEVRTDAIAALVMGIAASHVAAASIDPLSLDPDTGYLAFPSALSWMWYDFSRSLARAHMGYCMRCGRAFPLIGHRGVKRVYCSRSCKTQDVNERNRRLKREVRARFLAGERVADIAPDGDLERTRNILSTWPRLKRLLDESIERNGWEGSGLLRRCMEQGLDLESLLSTRHWDEWQLLQGGGDGPVCADQKG